MPGRSACWPNWPRGSAGMNDAETLLRRAVEIAPEFHRRRAPIWRWSSAGLAGRPRRSTCSTTSSPPNPTTIGHLNLKAATLGRLGDFDEAHRPLRERAGARRRASRELWLSYGHMLKTVGRPGRGIAAYRKAIALKPDAGRSVVEPGQPEDGALRRGRHRGDARGARGVRNSATRTAFTSISRSARRCTTPGDATRRSLIMRRPMRCGRSSQPYRAGGHDSPRRPQHRDCSRARHSRRGPADARRATRSSSSACRAPDRLWSNRSSRRTAWSRAPAELPDIPALAREAARLSRHRARADQPTNAARWARNISSARRSSGAPTGRSSSTSCPTTGCSCRSSS